MNENIQADKPKTANETGIQIDIFTDDSNTTIEPPGGKSLKDYFGGSFSSISSSADLLSEYGVTKIHILSSRLGYVRGSDNASTYFPIGDCDGSTNSATQEIQTELIKASKNSDVILLLFSHDSFVEVVSPLWSDLLETAEGNIWCIAATSTMLNTLNIDKLLDNGCKIVTYQRVGVARIGKETRKNLINLITQRIERNHISTSVSEQ